MIVLFSFTAASFISWCKLSGTINDLYIFSSISSLYTYLITCPESYPQICFFILLTSEMEMKYTYEVRGNLAEGKTKCFKNRGKHFVGSNPFRVPSTVFLFNTNDWTSSIILNFKFELRLRGDFFLFPLILL